MICDADKDPGLTATAIETEKVKGTVIGSVAAVFVNSPDRETEEISFTAEGEGTLTYYVSGVAAGRWTINGGTRTAKATEDGGLLVFTAPAGTVTLTPTAN